MEQIIETYKSNLEWEPEKQVPTTARANVANTLAASPKISA
jgi:hypothetical protein